MEETHNSEQDGLLAKRSPKSPETEQENSENSSSTIGLTKTESNRKNSLKSTGPRTPRGKYHSRCNAVKHGFYSKELRISDSEAPEYKEMRTGLAADLEPCTTVQWIAFDIVAVCCWRCKLALRLENRLFANLIQDKPEEDNHSKDSDGPPVMARWYGHSRTDIKAGIRSLEFAIKEFELIGYFKEETKTFLTQGFGPEFVASLESWKTTSTSALRLAEHIEALANRYPSLYKDFPSSYKTTGEANSALPELPDSSKVVIDPMQRQHMVVKLLEERRNFLNELLVLKAQPTQGRNADEANYVDLNLRFLADANREWRRALDHYFDLKNKRL